MIVNSYLGHRMTNICPINKSNAIIASQLTNIISPQQGNSFLLSLDEVLNLYKEDIESFNGELINKKECELKGAQYCIQVQYVDDIRTTDIIWEVRYLKLVDVDTRDSLEKILHQLRISNPNGCDSLISCFDPNEAELEEPGQIFKDGYTKYSCLEKFNNLKEGFQLAIFVPDTQEVYCDASVVEDIITSFLELDKLEEESLKIVEGELIENQLKISAVLAKDASCANLIVNQSILKESNWSSTIYHRNDLDLYLTSSRINFKMIDKPPPSYYGLRMPEYQR